jgi:PST family polysaccharide transporter
MTFALQICSTVTLARLLSPEDFGLQGMVLVITGFLGLVSDAGLGVVSIQREVLTHEETSALFWINVAVGVGLMLAVMAMAPLVAGFYHEPRLLLIALASAPAFLLSGLAVQHRALLNRALRFVTIAGIEVLSYALSVATGVVMALLGCGYWALVGMALSTPLVSSVAAWIAMPWLPGRPRRIAGIRSMLHMGGTVTLNTLVVYLAYNAEKVLLGRFWGAEALGLYGRAYQLANLPVKQLNASIGSVAFPALSRVQVDQGRLSRLFLRGYTTAVSLTIAVVVAAVVFAEEIVHVLLGPRWEAVGTLLRLLAPAVLVFGLINPLSWLLRATGRVRRSLHLALLIAPVVILGIAAGLPYGPPGVAAGYSGAMLLLAVPVVAWAEHGTGITPRHHWGAVRQPLLSGMLAGGAAGLLKLACAGTLPPIVLLVVGLTFCLAVYAWMLLVVMGQKHLYADLLRELLRRRSPGA